MGALDIALGRVVKAVQEAGGVLTGFGGEEVSFTRPIMLIGANNRKNYDRLRAIVEKHMDHLPYTE